jgi:hypothetical protein
MFEFVQPLTSSHLTTKPNSSPPPPPIAPISPFLATPVEPTLSRLPCVVGGEVVAAGGDGGQRWW